MKNVLLATTAIVAFSATAAAAEISLSGSAEIGLTINNDAPYDEVTVHTDVDLNWTLTGTTDNGLTFGANIDWDEAPTEEDASVFVSGAFGTFTAGDTDSAFAANVANLAGGGLADEADNAFESDLFDGGVDGESQRLRYDIAFGPATVSASFENGRAFDDSGDDAEDLADVYLLGLPGGTGAVSAEFADGDKIAETLGLGATFNFGMVTVGAGYQTNDDFGDSYGLSVEGDLGPASLVAHYINAESDLTVTDGATTEVYGISATFTFGMTEVGAQYQVVDISDVTADPTLEGDEDLFGVFVNYDLGGGATFTAAAGEDIDGDSLFGFGVGMSF